tara:strand:+ start:5864 stop:6244 length:381 start_codon:yes stop_codon:yes gene_type:complete
MTKKKILGLVELVTIYGTKGSIRKKALLDTGATRSSVDVRVAAKAGIGPIVASVKVKSKTAPEGFVRRAVAKAVLEIHDKRIPVDVSIEDRKNMPYKVLIGRDVIHSNFLIDLEKTHKSHKIVDMH